MNAARPKAAGTDRRGGVFALVTRPFLGRFSSLAAFLVLVALFVGGFSFAWKRWGDLVLNNPRYQLDEEHLEITPQPEWIRANVKREVMRDGSLGELRVLDPQVTVRVARAFGLHTWVAEVKRVRKEHPGRVVVELEYRRPAAMVEVTTRGERGLLPVDAKGVLLPPQDFTAEQTRDYVRIVVGDTLPVGPVGTPWGDDRVSGSARIAGVIGPRWKELELARITPRPNETGGRRRPEEIEYELFTRSGTRIIWGHSIGYERTIEATGLEKVARLVRFFEERPNRSVESLDIDVQGKAGLTVAPLTATRPITRPADSNLEH